MIKLVLASKSKVRKEILNKHKIVFKVEPSTVDEEPIKQSLLKEKATPEIISKNLAEIKAGRVSQKNFDTLVLGADSVIDLNGELISKPNNREKALTILKNLNGKTHLFVFTSLGDIFAFIDLVILFLLWITSGMLSTISGIIWSNSLSLFFFVKSEYVLSIYW